jgi:spore coat polysaccharide biosynthesis predicted glycosyltransferase SpsG
LVTSAVSSDGADWPVRPGTRLLLGPRYALVREQFSVRKRSIERTVSRVLVTTGGTDLGGWVTRLVRAVRETLPGAVVDVIVGPYFASESVRVLDTLAAACPNVVLHRNVADVRDLMLNADIAVTGGGQTLFELAATGTPAIAVCLAENQTANLISLHTAGSLVYAGRLDHPDVVSRIREAVTQLSSSWDRREQMSLAGRTAVDGEGPARVAEALLQLGRSHAAI